AGSDSTMPEEESLASESESEVENAGQFPSNKKPWEVPQFRSASQERLHIYVLEKRLAAVEAKLLENLKDKKPQTDKERASSRSVIRKKARRISNPSSLPTLSQVVWLSYDGFKNNSRDDEYQCAIEVLSAGFDLKQEIEEIGPQVSFDSTNDPTLLINHGKPRRSERSTRSNMRSAYRVRIRSPSLLLILNKVIGYGRMDCTTFARPFKPLIFHHDTMKTILSDLEAKWGETERNQPAEHWSILRGEKTDQSALEPGSARKRNLSTNNVSADMVDSVQALRAMRVYVEFVDSELIPLYHQFEEQNGKVTPNRVRFDDLWYLFRLGGLLFNPNAPNPTNGKARDRSFRSRRVMRVYSITYPDHGTDGYSQNDKVLIRCYSIDHNGESYIPVKGKVTIPYFEGEKDIQSLDIYPVRFAQDHQRILQELDDQGRLFQRCISEKYLFYKGWTIGDYDYPEYIDSDVIVDFVEALKAHPRWSTISHIPALHDGEDNYSVMIDDVPGTIWTDKERTQVAANFQDEIYTGTSIDTKERNLNLKNDKFLSDQRERRRNPDGISSDEVEDEDFVLFPRRLFAYSLQDRKFVPVDIRKLRLVADQGEQFKNVFIAKEHKKMINAVVDSHFERKDIERDPKMANMSQDIIQNKGRGLVILLHGVPGVGKTSTAEAVANAKKKPLFTITCGDLGFSPSEVESSLKEIFRLAHLWDCVLLMDEADVFLSQRSTWDLKRNALVSVFLRILEYYNGILFLTTNRVGTLDEAFKSRIHVILYYPPLSKNQTEGIWRINIRKLKQIEEERHIILDTGSDSDEHAELPLKVDEEEILDFALSHWQQHQYGKGRWNGRQIRNAFQIAAALARFEMRTVAKKREMEKIPNATPEALQGELRARHFRAVAETSHHFEMYMNETMGKTDAEIALEQGNRADHVSRLKQKMTEKPVIREHLDFDYYEGHSGGENNHREGIHDFATRRGCFNFPRNPT
ncbi:hypothetical protein N7481_012247, partial [Penicillium waksmanii]|uniref:uncharacterized protein n=1 Tax=Penicillium waksmanii TaxID=69791 RepID=UPI0025476F66